MKPLKILLVTAGPITGARLTREMGQIPELQLVGQVSDLSQAYIKAEVAEPDVALIGAELARHAEFEGLLSLFRVIGTGWLEIDTDGRVAPGTAPPPRFASQPYPAAGRIRTGMPAAAMLQLLQAAKPARPAGPPLLGTRAPPPSAVGSLTAPRSSMETQFDPAKLVLIGASTGGIDALQRILSEFPPDCPPTVIVQHTGSAFSASLIRLFARCSAAQVIAASPGLALQPGVIIVGAGSPGHLQLAPNLPLRSELRPGPPISGHTPSIDALFQSAVGFGPNVVAALLTGMGRDGAQGLLELRRSGAVTLAQDEASAVVYGMPKAAVELGAVEASLPLNRMAVAILNRCRKRQPLAAFAR